MNIDELTLGQIKQLQTIVSANSSSDAIFPEPVGQAVFIRTVTMYYTGQVKKLCGQFVTLEKAAWIPDTGRFSDFLKNGKANEVEPFHDDVHIPLSSIIDVTKWQCKLPQEQT
jgi:hypothetical protein